MMSIVLPREAQGRRLAQLLVTVPPAGEAGAPPEGAHKLDACLDAWRDDPDTAAAAERLRAICTETPRVRGLLIALANASPFLWDLASSDGARLLALLESDPDAHLAVLLETAFQTVSAAADLPDESAADAVAMRALRRMRAEAALLIAIADIGGVWPLSRVIDALTGIADTAVRASVRFLLRGAVAKGDFAPSDPAQPEAGSGYAILAMGKMGACELNYSSDIDLIVFYDAAAPGWSDKFERAPYFVRLTRRLVKLLQERTIDGYVFRVDLRLRPDPASTQIAVSVESALDYYESVGQNWERAAMIKARLCAGDEATGAYLLQSLSPFVWRKYLDYAAIIHVHAMKKDIHTYKGHGEIAVEGHNIKLGRGGIREVEFFVQTQQIIAGGRHPELRGRQTLPMLVALAAGQWISDAARDELTAAYLFLRNVEHRLQMVADEQTQTLPADREELERFARFLGYETRDAFAADLVGHLTRVQRHYGQLFERDTVDGAQALHFPPDSDDAATLDSLLAMGFRKPLQVSALVRRWFDGSYRALRSELTREQFAALLPILLSKLARLDNADAALLTVDKFLTELHGSGRLFTLLRQNTDLVAFIVLILGSAPRLADTLAHYPQVIDSLIDPNFFGDLPRKAQLADNLAVTLTQAGSYEDYLDRIRIFAQEQMFLIGARILAETVNAEQAGEWFSNLADVLIGSLFGAVNERLLEAHGRIKGQRIALLALGKLGGREMTATSDLDLIVIYDFDEDAPESDGRSPLYGGQYFARLTQRLIGALTAQTNFGVLYDVDMRLRPSGRAGPLATSLSSFESYQADEAWTWERMALTRARVVADTEGFAKDVQAVITGVLCQPRDPVIVAADVYEMRRAIATEKGEAQRWNLKHAAGGQVDIEFIAQYLQLVHAARHPEILDLSTMRVLTKALRLKLLSQADADILLPAVRLYQDLTQILRLCLRDILDPAQADPNLLGLLSRAGDVPDFQTLDAYVAETQVKVRACFERLLDPQNVAAAHSA